MKSTDAYLLMQFAADTAAIRPLTTKPSPAQESVIRAAGTPCIKGLQQNGHSFSDAMCLMCAVLAN